jgi:ABC-type dipeptide/oligopeptide/nickel transport system ATPase subunit
MQSINHTLEQIQHYNAILKNIEDIFQTNYQSMNPNKCVPYDTIIKQKIPEKDFPEFSEYCFNCNCCVKHQQKKSLIINNSSQIISRHVDNISHIEDCDCICRQFGRKLSLIYKS